MEKIMHCISSSLFQRLPFFLCLTFCVFLSTTAQAQNNGERILPPLKLRLNGDFVSEASFKDDKGDMGRYSAGFRAQMSFLNFSYSMDNFTWKDKDKLPFGNGHDAPWKTLHRLRLGANYGGSLSKNWTWSGGIFGTASYEKEMEDAFGGGARLGVGYQISKRWDVGFGVALFANSISTRVLPYLAGFKYNGKNDQGQGWFLHLGFPGSEVGYAFSDNFALRAGVDTDSKFYRLANDSDVLEKGYVQLEGWQALFRVDYSPIRHLEITAGPTLHFNRNVTTYRHDGDKVTDEDLGNALGGMLQIRYKF